MYFFAVFHAEYELFIFYYEYIIYWNIDNSLYKSYINFFSTLASLNVLLSILDFKWIITYSHWFLVVFFSFHRHISVMHLYDRDNRPATSIFHKIIYICYQFLWIDTHRLNLNATFWINAKIIEYYYSSDRYKPDKKRALKDEL